MRKVILLTVLLGTLFPYAFTQTNAFPPDGNVGIGTTNPENNGGWDKVLEVRGYNHSKFIVTTANAGIQTGMWSHSLGGYNAPIGGISGTTTNHPFSFITNGSNRLTIGADGTVGILGNVGLGVMNPENNAGWGRVLEIQGVNHSKMVVTTTAETGGIQTGVWSNYLGAYNAPIGGITGTATNHPYSLVS